MSGPAARIPSSRFDAAWLAQRLQALLPEFPADCQLCVAWSGGADSTALLAALIELRNGGAAHRRLRLRALHVNHHLQAAAAQFARHCRRQARSWRLPLTILDVRPHAVAGDSVEEAARDARYGALAAALRPGEFLLTAQHADDQLETVLLQLLRGGALAGLAGMAEQAPLGAGLLLRPLLAQAGPALRDYLVTRQISWIEDPSNAVLRFDRNYLRTEVLPQLLQRWPAAARTVARTARRSAEGAAVARTAAGRDAQAAADGADLEIAVLRRLTPARQRAALRAWIAAAAHPTPDERRLLQVQGLLGLREDAQPRVHWAGVEVRRHAGRLCLVGLRQAGDAPRPLRWDWQRHARLSLPGGGSLHIRPDPWGDVDVGRLPRELLVDFPGGGERIVTAVGRRDVKSVLREAGVPVWERASVPLVSTPQAALLAIADLWCSDDLHPVNAGARRGRFVWQQQ